MMFDFDVKVLHLESSSNCNAECPQCPRENKALFCKNNTNDLTLTKCKELFDIDFIQGLDKMFMCGNFGDPVSNKHTLDIFRYFKKHNRNITLGLNTNGSIQNPSWWKELASIFTNNTDYVVFSIDGLEDTNHIYRKRVNWKKVINNAVAFINAGGSAQWDMLIFEHNEHQVNQAHALANELGFTWFRTKVSKRFIDTPDVDIKPPLELELPNVLNTTAIKCHAYNERSVYVSASGKVLPCCWIGVHEFINDEELSSLLSSLHWNGLINSWSSKPIDICSNACGINEVKKTSFESQWTNEFNLR